MEKKIRRVFYSFYYKEDYWRASQIRNMGVIEGNASVSDNDWEAITSGGDEAIKKWINEQLNGKSCAIVLIGTNTAGRKWINYEIKKAWDDGKGLLGIYIHNLEDNSKPSGRQSQRGSNPFDGFTVGEDKKKLSDVVKAYNPPFVTSTYVYNHIKENLGSWVEEAITIRNSV